MLENASSSTDAFHKVKFVNRVKFDSFENLRPVIVRSNILSFRKVNSLHFQIFLKSDRLIEVSKRF